jgi:DNA-binding transcriptional LysR family regulator
MHDHRLNTFYTVANLKSFSAAASALKLTQPTVSFQIRQLEFYYGTKLIDTRRRQVELTEAGKRVFDYARKIKQLYYEMDRSVNSVAMSAANRILIGANATIGEYVLPPIIGDFQTVSPELSVFLRIENRQHLLKLLQEEQIDLAIIGGKVDEENLVPIEFVCDEMVLIAAPDSSHARLAEVNPEEFDDTPLILREEGSASRSQTLQALEDAGINTEHLRQKLTLGSMEAIKRAVEAGLGVAIVPRLVVMRELEQGTLKAVPIANMRIKRKFYFVYKSSYFKEILIHRFIGFARVYHLEAGRLCND